MKGVLKYILIGLVVAWIYMILAVNLGVFFGDEMGITLATGVLLSFEMVVCTGVIINRTKKFNERNE